MKSSTTEEWEQVTVNDEYAMSNPTMIVVPCEEGLYTDPCYGSNYESEIILPGGGGGGGGTGSGDDSPPACVDGEPCGHKVQVGWMKLTKQWDGLFAGGSLIKFISIDAIKYYPTDSTPQTVQIALSQHFSRGEIEDGDWKWLSTQFDQDWEEYELGKDFQIYEPDNGETTLDLSAEVAGVGSVSVSFDLSADRATLLKTTYQRDQFFANNDESFGNGMKGGEQVRHAGGLYWTFSITEYAY